MEVRKKRSHQIDMLHGPIFSKLCLFALPLALASILQQLFNSADTAVVGRFSSSAAMAAVGANTAVVSMLINLVTGLSVGANVVIANYIGQDRRDKVNSAVHSIIVFSLICGVVMLIIGQVIAEPILALIDTPANVIDMATAYLKIYFIGMPFICLYNFGAAILRSIGDSQRPLYCLIVSGIVNVFLNLFFVIVVGMNADGVAVATTISNFVSAAMVLIFLMREKGMLHLDLKKLHMRKEDIIQTIKVGGPAGLQGMVFAISNVIIQSAINSFGSDAVAGVSAGQNFEYFSYFVVNSFAQAAVTFTSQNYAAKQYDRCKKVFKMAMIAAVLMTAALSAVFILARYPLIRIFSHDPHVIHYAIIRMLLVTTFEFMTASYEVTGSCLRGIGYSMIPAVETIFGSVIYRVIYVQTIFKVWHTFDVLTAVYISSWILTGTVVIITYIIITRRAYRIEPAH